MSSGFWLDRPTLVTGATGLVGGWVVRRLLRAQADVVCLVRDWAPDSEFERSGLSKQVKLVEKLLALTGSRLTPDVRNEASHEIKHQSLSAAKARDRLGWSPLFTLDEGLAKTVPWYRNFLGVRKAA